MDKTPDWFDQLVQCLRYLPGVGPRSAERLAYHLLKTRERSQYFAHVLAQTLTHMQQCERCNHYTQTPVCARCDNKHRDPHLLCVVEQPHDLLAIEQSEGFSGGFYVLMGRISPLDGIGPEELNFSRLVKRIKEEAISEVILALSPTVEGQTTMNCIQTLLSNHPIRLTQLAQGIPLGGELASLDGFTIANAIRNRALLS